MSRGEFSSGWTSERGSSLFQTRAGKASARSPKHFPIAEARRIRLERIPQRTRLAAERAEFEHDFENARRRLQSTRIL